MRSMFKSLVVVTLAVAAFGCATNQHQMLRVAIGEFSKTIAERSQWKIWITGPTDTCLNSSSSGVAGAAGALAGFTGGGDDSDMAVEVFSNYLTQTTRGRVIEKSHANYATDTQNKTRLYSSAPVTSGDDKVQQTIVGTFEDMCILDEAKKRYADKVLRYEILMVKKNEMDIHLRLSDVKTGIVESSRSLKIKGTAASELP